MLPLMFLTDRNIFIKINILNKNPLHPNSKEFLVCFEKLLMFIALISLSEINLWSQLILYTVWGVTHTITA